MISDDIQRAIDTEAIIEIAYTKSDGTTSVRRLSEVRYSEEYGKTHIDAFCHLRNEYRSFRISRISRVTFISSQDESGEQSGDSNPEASKKTYKFDSSKRIFPLYGFDYV